MSRKLEIYKIVKMGVKSNEKSKNSTLLEQIFKEGSHDTPAHHADSAGAVFGNIENTLQIMEYMDKVQRVMRLKKIPHKGTN